MVPMTAHPVQGTAHSAPMGKFEALRKGLRAIVVTVTAECPICVTKGSKSCNLIRGATVNRTERELYLIFSGMTPQGVASPVLGCFLDVGGSPCAVSPLPSLLLFSPRRPWPRPSLPRSHVPDNSAPRRRSARPPRTRRVRLLECKADKKGKPRWTKK